MTATLGSTYVFGTVPDGWTPSEDGRSATFDGTVALNKCALVSPLSPTVTASVCVAGETVLPKVTLPADERVPNVLTYSDVKAADNGDGTMTFTFTVSVANGYVLVPQDQLPANFTRDSGIQATYSITLPLVDCQSATPTLPTPTYSVCVAGEPTDPTAPGACRHTRPETTAMSRRPLIWTDPSRSHTRSLWRTGTSFRRKTTSRMAIRATVVSRPPIR